MKRQKNRNTPQMAVVRGRLVNIAPIRVKYADGNTSRRNAGDQPVLSEYHNDDLRGVRGRQLVYPNRVAQVAAQCGLTPAEIMKFAPPE